MFGKICSNPKNRKLILDSLLQIDFQEKDGTVEKHIQKYKDSKFARLDLLSEDYNGKIYNAEMQNKSTNSERQKELLKRSRYYQGLIDTDYLGSGKKYTELPETYIIFICTFDPFNKNQPIYSFDTICKEVDLPEFSDQTHKIFFNTTADLSSLPQSMQNMLKYIETGITSDAATLTINKAVTEARLMEEWRNEYMLNAVYEDDIFADGEASGLIKGEINGRIAIIASFLSNGGTIEAARNQLNATEAEIQSTQNRVADISHISN